MGAGSIASGRAVRSISSRCDHAAYGGYVGDMDIQMVSSSRAEPSPQCVEDPFAPIERRTDKVAVVLSGSPPTIPECTDKRPVRILRRTVDIAVAAVGLLVLGIPMLILAAIIVIDSRGTAWYGSWRLSKGAKPFRCWKFRTMHHDAHARLADYLSADSRARDEYERYHKLLYDPRITRVGSFLRATSLDELPQLINVLFGQMSLVGPRPYLLDELAELREAQEILGVKPGITGLWQVTGRNERTFRQRVRLERFYASRRNLGWDAELLLRTVDVVVQRKGAH